MPEWTVAEGEAGQRVDIYLAGHLNGSRAEAQRLLETGAASVNGRPARPHLKLKPDDTVAAERPEPMAASAQPEDIPLHIVYEDGDVLVIDKPRGMVVHPAPGNPNSTLVNAVLAHAADLSGIGGELRPGIVHRLDRDTSGLLVVAKNDAAHINLQKQIQQKTAQRHYLAVVWGSPRFEHAIVEAPIGRHPVDRKKMAVLTDGQHRARPAVTELIVRERFPAFTLVEARLQTGRTHQIRVHCAHIGHPVAADPVYGGERRVPSQGFAPADRARIEAALHAMGGQALHAFLLAFDHPRTGERLCFEVEPPAVMRDLIELLRQIAAR